MKGNKIYGLSLFRIKIIAALGGLIGVFLISSLPFQLNPTSNEPSLTINFSFFNGSPLLVENEITSKFERAFASLEELEEISSISRSDGGSIQLKFNKNVNFDRKRLEVVSLVRQVFPLIKDKISFPQIINNNRFGNEEQLMTFTLVSNLDHKEIESIAFKYLINPLSSIKGIGKIELVGIEKEEWQIILNDDLINQLGITNNHVFQSVNNQYKINDIGWLNTKSRKIFYLQFGNLSTKNIQNDIGNIIVRMREGRPILLKDIASIKKGVQTANSYFRINGKQGINLIIYPDKSTNRIQLSKKIRHNISEVKPILQPSIKLFLLNDSSVFFAKEIQKIIYRVIGSFLILSLLILLIYPIYYLRVIYISTLVALLWSGAFYYITNLQLHSYSLAGFTLSLGILLDNFIIMTDHIQKKRNKNIIIALIAANLTTIGVFVVVFLLEPKYRLELIDFLLLFSINLLMSLLIALWLIPALVQKKISKKRPFYKWRKRARTVLWFNKVYGAYFNFIHKKKLIIFLILIITFGIPFFALPDSISSNHLLAKIYNESFGSNFFQKKLHPQLDKYLGGTLSAFVDKKDDFFLNFQKQEQTKLHVNASLPYGSTIVQMNMVMQELERYLEQFPEISKFQTTVKSYKNGRIDIEFTEEAGNSGFPSRLKGLLLNKTRETGAAKFRIFGVGKNFGSLGGEKSISEHLKLTGYNYLKLKEIAESEKSKLLKNKRIERVLISSKVNWIVPDEKYFVINFDSSNLILSHGLDYNLVGNQIKNLNPDKGIITSIFQEHILPIRLLSNRSNKSNYFWNVKELPLPGDSIQIYKNKSFISLNEKLGIGEIHRKNQEYQLFIEYEFLGNQKLADKYKKEKIKAIQASLPLGFQIKEEEVNWWEENFSKNLSVIIFFSVLIIFTFCAILFNSLRWGILPLLMIPFSFIGIFSGVLFFDFKFDQGGMVAFLLVAGLSVNSMIFVINDYLILKKERKGLSAKQLFLKSFNGKIIPILLTAISTCLGLFPFLIFDKDQPFWYALAICTIFGVIFSIIALYFLCPLLFPFSSDA